MRNLIELLKNIDKEFIIPFLAITAIMEWFFAVALISKESLAVSLCFFALSVLDIIALCAILAINQRK